MEGTEKSPLIKRQVPDTSSEKDAGENQTDYKHESYRSVEDNANREEFKDTVRLKRHITLPYAVAIMVGNVIGSGIFLSPKGVADNAGSVGASLLIWGATGLYNLAQALCYAELGTMIPRAGGDYAYIYEILGPLPAFMLLWIHIVVIASCSCALIARTAGLYLLEPLDMDCHLWLITLIAILIIVTLAAINAYSAVWGTRAQTVFTVSKVLALVVVIVAGIVKLCQGHTDNFEHAFNNTSNEPGSIALAVLDGYFAYKGWELINALPEEMVNPSRDLPLTAWISMLMVTGIYVMANVAYFSVLSPTELIQSDAVALTFADRALGPFKIIIPVAVALSCMGAVNGDFLSNSRYLFAGGRYRQLPKVVSFISIKRYTPILGVAILCVIALLYTVLTDLQKLQEYTSLTVQLKMMLCFIALFYLRYKKPDLPRPMKVNTVIAVVTFILQFAVIGLSFYQSPVATGIGAGICLLGIPLYGLMVFCRSREAANNIMDDVTWFLQRLLLLAPESTDTSEHVTILDK